MGRVVVRELFTQSTTITVNDNNNGCFVCLEVLVGRVQKEIDILREVSVFVYIFFLHLD